MKDLSTLSSLPGEWIDRRGRPQPRFPIHRILVMKCDHIGDLLIADQAFALLRSYFPGARIELVCGTWNVALARRLGRFDVVHGVNLFHEVSGRQSDLLIAEEVRRSGAALLAGLGLGPFDLAIDLRYDADSRPLLQNVDARVYAGFGTSAEFPFLDVVLPRHDPVEAASAAQVVLTGRNLGPRLPGGTIRPTAGQGGGELSARRTELVLAFDIQGAATPRECGTANDDRRLGIGLESITVTPAADAEGTPSGPPVQASPSYGPGWGSPELWGTWTVDDRAVLGLSLPRELKAPFLRVEVRMRAHVNAANPVVACAVGTGADGEEGQVEFDFPAHVGSLSFVVPCVQPRVALASAAFQLAPGRYHGLLRLYLSRPPERSPRIEFAVRSLTGHAELMRRAVTLGAANRGIVSLPFECKVETAGEQLRFELDTLDAQLLDGARVEYVSFVAEEQFKVRTPAAHMGHWASLLVLRVAQLFSDQPPFGRAAPHRGSVLTAVDARPDMPDGLRAIRERLDRWRAEGAAVVGMALGCNTLIRKWPLPYFVELAEALLRLGEVRIVFIGSPADREEAVEACVQLGLDTEEHALCGATRLDDLGLLLDRLDLFIGSNTGTTHFAGKVGVRTIGVYAGTNHPREWGPIGENASWLYRDEPCAPCHLTDLAQCMHAHVCLLNLVPEDVLAVAAPEVRAVLSARRATSARVTPAADAAPRPVPQPHPAAEKPAPSAVPSSALEDAEVPTAVSIDTWAFEIGTFAQELATRETGVAEAAGEGAERGATSAGATATPPVEGGSADVAVSEAAVAPEGTKPEEPAAARPDPAAEPAPSPIRASRARRGARKALSG